MQEIGLREQKIMEEYIMSEKSDEKCHAVSICIITRNEQEYLKNCLSHIKEYGQEIVVVDTGSTDGSIDVAKEYTDKVYSYVWCDDFSAARNYAAKMASNDMVMVLDTDEFVEPLDIEKLLQVIASNTDSVGRIKIRNIYEQNGQQKRSNERISRIYDKNKFRYEGSVHEQIVSIDGSSYETYEAPVVAEHMGYAGDVIKRKKKAERNITLLKKLLNEKGDEPYILYQLGKSFYYEGEYEAAAEYFEKMLDMKLDLRLEYVVDMITTYGYALLNSNQKEKAMLLEGVYEDFKSSADFVFMMGLVYMNNAMFDNAIFSFEEASKIKDCMVEGVNSQYAFYNIGVINECLGRTDEAKHYYKKCGGYEPALNRLKIIG